MKLLGLYLQEFNREYWLTPADRWRTRQTVIDALAYLALFLIAALMMWGLG